MTIERCSMNISPKKLFNVHCSMLNCHLKICGRGRVIAVPVDDFTVLVFQESQKTAVRSILEAMASRLDGVAGLDGVGCHPRSLKSAPARCFQTPGSCFSAPFRAPLVPINLVAVCTRVVQFLADV